MNNSKNPILTSERLNLVIAICAILISAASFYATFLQADSAEKQVRAMTLPLLQFDHGNYNSNLNQRIIHFTLSNAGVGPAIIHSIQLAYRDDHHASLTTFSGPAVAPNMNLTKKMKKEFLPRKQTYPMGGW
ncbi:MAG: hypothetical protein RQ757_11390 [Pseudomonadales bacterium]|nr:hypothetical protein [Pseudomonadales bacterium]